MVADIARHWAAVAAVDRQAAASAASWAVRAGDAAMLAAATDEAISRYEEARRLWSASTADHADTLIRLGTALYSCGRTEEADEQFRAALHLARGLGDSALLARSALGLSRTLTYRQVDAERIAALEEAIGGLGPEDQILRPAATVMLQRQLTFDHSAAGRARHDQLATEVVAALDRPDLPLELLLLVGSIHDSIPLADPAPLDRLAKQMISVASRRKELVVLANGWWAHAWSALERADPTDWQRSLDGYDAVAAQLGLDLQLGVAASMRSAAAQIEGRTQDAQSLSDQAFVYARAANDPNAEAISTARSVLIGLDLGLAADLLPVMVALSTEYSGVATFAGDTALARRLLTEHGSNGFVDIPANVERPAVIAFYAHACVLTSDTEHAEALHALLCASAATAVRVGPLTGWWGPVDHHVGALCRVLGRLDEARHHLQTAVEIETRMHAAPFLARSEQELARVVEALEG
jgi:tetratricopeptide (TPR) repeat protein